MFKIPSSKFQFGNQPPLAPVNAIDSAIPKSNKRLKKNGTTIACIPFILLHFLQLLSWFHVGD